MVREVGEDMGLTYGVFDGIVNRLLSTNLTKTKTTYGFTKLSVLW